MLEDEEVFCRQLFDGWQQMFGQQHITIVGAVDLDPCFSMKMRSVLPSSDTATATVNATGGGAVPPPLKSTTGLSAVWLK